MADGLRTTFDLLTETLNEAAVGVLIAALDSPEARIREEALRSILKRRSRAGHQEVLRRMHRMDDRWRSIVRDHWGRMANALRDATLGTDPQTCANACAAIIGFKEFDLMPALINAAEDESNANAEILARTILKLAENLEEHSRHVSGDRQPGAVREHLVQCLGLSVKRRRRDSRNEIVEAFLLLADRDNELLRGILQDPRDPSYLAVVDVLTHSVRPALLELLLSFLEDPQAPFSAIATLAHRTDLDFVVRLLDRIGAGPSAVIKKNLRRVEDFAWLANDVSVLERLDEGSQSRVIQLVMASRMKRWEAFKTVQHLLVHGSVAGRRAACAALAEFHGVEANGLAMQALDDPDPQVQATALVQLRPRGIPRAVSRLIEMIDSPHPEVSSAAREQLKEFTVERFLAVYESLEERVRRSTGLLVQKVDPHAVERLAAEMRRPARSRRLRAISVAFAIEAVHRLESPLIDLLCDEDHIVRAEAARALACCDSIGSRQALGEALADPSVTVQIAAKQSLETLGFEAAAHESGRMRPTTGDPSTSGTQSGSP